MVQSDKKPTQFERAMQDLDIHLIFANSPQARGRTERINGAFKDRLVAELPLYRIVESSEATHYLNHHFIPKYSRRFGTPPEDPQAAWRGLPPALICPICFAGAMKEPSLTINNTISVKGQIVQLIPSGALACQYPDFPK